jgi:prolyl 4-hydroxylase
MSVLQQAQQLFRRNRQPEAVALVTQAAERGDVEAIYAVANWKLFAVYIGRDLGGAIALLRRAKAAGHADSALLLATLIANGTGIDADPRQARLLLEQLAPTIPRAAAQVGMLSEIDETRSFPATILSETPAISWYDNVLSAAECNWIMAHASPRLEPSFVNDPVSGGRMPHPVRTSSGTSFGPTQEDVVVNAIIRRIARVSGTGYECGEPLQILRYNPGEQYRPHMDALPGEANQRSWTALVYLNDGYGGGETSFPELGIKVGGKAGAMLLFANTDADGRPDHRTVHAGEPVTTGEKWLATRWIRTRPYHPWTA